MDIQTAYNNTIEYLYQRLPMFSRIGKAALKPDLTNTIKFCEALDNPQDKFKSIHIAGTNGKGSTSHMMSAILQANGYKTGLYTSPHLLDFRERIRINGVPVSKEWVVDFVDKNKALIEEIEPSFFEITVAMAFQFFAEQEVDIAVIETGLGGRLDSTNIITPLLSIITNISYDHKDLLGDTLPQIASEKAGIIKHGVPVVIGELEPETENVFFEHSLKNQSTLYEAETMWDLVRVKQDANHQYFKLVDRAKREMYDLTTDLLGDYQQHNIKTVLAATDILKANSGLSLDFNDTLHALSHVKGLTGLRGRWDKLQDRPLIIADVGHNVAGIKEVMHQLNNVNAKYKHIVVGFVKDKDVQEALSLFPKDALYYFCNAQIARALPAEQLNEIAVGLGFSGKHYNSVDIAVKAAKLNMADDDVLLITGSFFIVGEAMESLGIII